LGQGRLHAQETQSAGKPYGRKVLQPFYLVSNLWSEMEQLLCLETAHQSMSENSYLLTADRNDLPRWTKERPRLHNFV
jgi:hypothetical protein